MQWFSVIWLKAWILLKYSFTKKPMEILMLSLNTYLMIHNDNLLHTHTPWQLVVVYVFAVAWVCGGKSRLCLLPFCKCCAFQQMWVVPLNSRDVRVVPLSWQKRAVVAMNIEWQDVHKLTRVWALRRWCGNSEFESHHTIRKDFNWRMDFLISSMGY